MSKILEVINFKALGTDIEIQLRGLAGNQEKIKAVLLEVQEVYFKMEKILSRFDPDSELSVLNNSLGIESALSYDILEIARRALYYNQLTQGMFDPRVIEALENIGYKTDFWSTDFSRVETKPAKLANFRKLERDLIIAGNQLTLNHRVDFSGLAKGYITDKIAKYLLDLGFQDFLINSGGDIHGSGEDSKKENWKVAIEGIPEEKLLLELDESFRGVATSGISRRKWEVGEKKFHHLINPSSPENFCFDLKTVTVVSKTTEEADVWAKVLFLMGKEAGMNFSVENNLKSLFINSRGNVYLSPAIKDNIINRE